MAQAGLPAARKSHARHRDLAREWLGYAFGYGLRLPNQWLTKSDAIPYAHSMRDRETIDSELRLLAAGRRSIREHGGEPSSRQVDALLDERLGHRAEASETEAVEAFETDVVAGTWSQHDETDDIRPYGRKGVPRRFGLLAALPLSLVAIATVLVVMFALHNPHPAAQPTVVPPSGVRPNPAAPKARRCFQVVAHRLTGDTPGGYTIRYESN